MKREWKRGATNVDQELRAVKVKQLVGDVQAECVSQIPHLEVGFNNDHEQS